MLTEVGPPGQCSRSRSSFRSHRRRSVNRSLARALSQPGAGFAFGFVQIDDLPPYKQDLEADLPKSAGQITSETVAAQGVFVRNAGAYLFNPERCEERDRLGRAPSRPEFLERQAGRHRRPIARRIRHSSCATTSAAGTWQPGHALMGGEAYVAFKPGPQTVRSPMKAC
jgi:hypothetical protein